MGHALNGRARRPGGAASVVAAAALVLSVALVTACASPHVRLSEGPRDYVASDYDSVRRLWTRSEEFVLIGQLENVLTVTTTYESWDFRWAYVVRYADDYRLTVQQREKMLKSLLEETRQRHTFYVALYTNELFWARIEDPKSAWIVRLIDDQGNETPPLGIEAIHDPDAVDVTYFPYTTPWRNAFRISFPTARADGSPTIAPNSKWFGLRFAGPQGHQHVVWNLSPEEVATAHEKAP